MNLFRLTQSLPLSSLFLSLTGVMLEYLTVFTLTSLDFAISSASTKEEEPLTQVHDPQTSIIGFTCLSLKGLKHLSTYPLYMKTSYLFAFSNRLHTPVQIGFFFLFFCFFESSRMLGKFCARAKDFSFKPTS